MSDSLEVSPDFIDPSLPGALRAAGSAAEMAGVLSRLAQRVEENRRVLAKHVREFETMYDEGSRRLSVDGLVELAERVRQGDSGARELLIPWMEALRQARVAAGPEGQRYIQDLLTISEAWLALYGDARERLLRLAADRRGAAGKIRHARPVAGEIDHEALTREIIARFPKILAALAE